MTVIAIAPESEAAELLTAYADERDLASDACRVISAGCVQLSAVTDFVGLSCPTEGEYVNLRAPEPREGRDPKTWLYFVGGMVANSENLVAVRWD